MNDAAISSDSDLLPLPLRFFVLCGAIMVALLHLGLIVYAAFKAWWHLPGPQATLWTIVCLFIPLPIVGPLILLAIVRNCSKKPRGT